MALSMLTVDTQPLKKRFLQCNSMAQETFSRRHKPWTSVQQKWIAVAEASICAMRLKCVKAGLHLLPPEAVLISMVGYTADQVASLMALSRTIPALIFHAAMPKAELTEPFAARMREIIPPGRSTQMAHQSAMPVQMVAALKRTPWPRLKRNALQVLHVTCSMTLIVMETVGVTATPASQQLILVDQVTTH
jgi:hypothetical protein